MSTNSRYRKVKKLREMDKLTFEEIGKRIGVTRQRAWELYNRAVKRSISTSSTTPEVSLST